MEVAEASDEALLSVHTPGLVAAIDALGPATRFPEQLTIAGAAGGGNGGAPPLGPDSLGNCHTARAARLAAGAAAGLAERLVRGEADGGFALVRPAGARGLVGVVGMGRSSGRPAHEQALAPLPTRPHRPSPAGPPCRPPDLRGPRRGRQPVQQRRRRRARRAARRRQPRADPGLGRARGQGHGGDL
jgi:hypothetical protein